jgi:uncharacterized protein
MRIFFDTVSMIYLVERVQPWYTRLVAKIGPTPHRIVISDLTRMECLVKPLRANDPLVQAEYLTSLGLTEIANLTPTVFDRAANIRANYNFKTIDSIHLATAIESQCDWFLTNDQKLANFPDIRVELP